MHPILTVDVLIEKSGAIVLIKRKKDPYKGKLALPGGFVNYRETVEAAAVREVREETSLEVKLVDILGVYSDPTRDPRDHVISVVFVGEPISGEPQAGDDASIASWYDLNICDQLDLAFDHGKVIDDYMKWKENRRTSWSTKESC
jgi:ADP-ribose pyrophosphatase YjhB (NUDIX family)